MEEKIISGSDKSCTVTVTGETTKVRFEVSCMYIQVKHLSGEIICGRRSDIADGANGTAKLTSGGICFDVASPVIYIGGNGVCEVYATNSETLVFKDAPAASGGGSENSKSVMTLIGTFAATQGQWASIGTLEAGTRLFIEQATLTAQATTTPSACTMHGYTLVPEFNKNQNLYFKVQMLSSSGVVQMNMVIQSNGNVQLTGTSASGVLGAFNVYKVEVPIA